MRRSVAVLGVVGLVACESPAQRYARQVEAARRAIAAGQFNEASNNVHNADRNCELDPRVGPDCAREVRRLYDDMHAASVAANRRVREEMRDRSQRRNQSALATSVGFIQRSVDRSDWESAYRECTLSLPVPGREDTAESHALFAQVRALCERPAAEVARACRARVEPVLRAGRLEEARALAAHPGCPRETYDGVTEAALALSARSASDPAQACAAVRLLGAFSRFSLSPAMEARFESERAPAERACVAARLRPVTPELRARLPLTAWLMHRLGAPLEGAAAARGPEEGPMFPPADARAGQYTVLRCERRERTVAGRSSGPATTSTSSVTNPVYTTRGNLTTMRMETTTTTTTTPGPAEVVLVTDYVAQVQFWDGQGPAMRFPVERERCVVGEHTPYLSELREAEERAVAEAQRRFASRTTPPAERLEAAIAVRHLDRSSTSTDAFLLEAFGLPANATLWPWHATPP